MPTNEELYAEVERCKAAGDLPAAVEKLMILIQQDPRHALSHSTLAVYLGKLGRHEEAIRHALEVCELEPNDPFSFTALSVTYVRAGRIPEAEDAKARASMVQARQSPR